MKLKITHVTSAHPRYDTRIFEKICSSLAENLNYQVNLIVADGRGDECKSSVIIYDAGILSGRVNRMFRTTKNVFQKAKALNSDIYHLHDPELIPIGVKLKRLGFKVIFDIHENISCQIKDKEYIPKIFRNSISFIYRIYEKKSLKKFDGLILAENSYYEYYKDLSNNIEIILNMPDISSLEKFVNKGGDKNEIFYIGGVSVDRGVDVIVDAIKIVKNKYPDIFMHYIGPFDKKIINNLDISSIEKNIKFYGEIPLFEGLSYSLNAKIGISILKPIDNYLRSYSTKIFEYMALGLPVITSDFQLYKDVIEKSNCGICINPLKPKEIARAIEYIIGHPKEAMLMGQNGRRAILKKYNWEVEEKKLLNFYKLFEDNIE